MLLTVEAERPCWESNAPLSDEKRDVREVVEGGVDVPCEAERGDNEPGLSLSHSPLHNTSTLSVPYAALIVLRLQYQLLTGWQPFISLLGCLCE